jgi:DNA-binding CsgD family transcriptional regulator
MSTAQRDAVRDITRICSGTWNSRDLRAEVARGLGQVIPHDAFCFGTLDPTTLVITDDVSGGLPPGGGSLAAYNEYQVPDVDKFAVLARSADPVGILSVSTGGNLQASHRFRTVLPLIGARHELRAAFVADGCCWGAIALFRGGGCSDFTAADAELLRNLSRPVAVALRRAVDGGPAATAPSGPGVIVVAHDDTTVMANEAGRWWLTESAIRRIAVGEVAAAARAGRGAAARARVRSDAGWVSLWGSLLDGAGQGAVSVVVEGAAAAEVAELTMLAHGLSGREQQVVRQLINGTSSAHLAANLRISRYTVQDHLKSIFHKFGVRSRAELVARVLGSVPL